MSVEVEGLSALAELDEITPRAKRAASQAINATARRTRTSSAREMEAQVAFPPGYLTGGKNARLSVTKFAKPDDLEATITGRHRPTSLARFVTSGNRGVTVTVKPGAAKKMARAFLIKLKSGTASIETAHNMGLAMRLKKGERIIHKHVMVPMKGDLYLLYTASVDQVFRTVAVSEASGAADYMEAEFARLLKL